MTFTCAPEHDFEEAEISNRIVLDIGYDASPAVLTSPPQFTTHHRLHSVASAGHTHIPTRIRGICRRCECVAEIFAGVAMLTIIRDTSSHRAGVELVKAIELAREGSPLHRCM